MASKEINWIKLGKEIANVQNGIAVLRMLEAHGVTHLMKFADSPGIGMGHRASIETLINYVHEGM